MARRFDTLQGRGIGRLRSLAFATAVAAMAAGAAGASAAPGAAIVVDAKTGKVLYSSNADAQRYPASLTKMMTLYLLFEAIDSGKTKLTSRIPISKFAASQAPTKLGLKPGSTISVEDAVLSLVTKSANDMAVAIAEYLGGTESRFAAKMTAKARAIGMSRTTFKNASGLPNTGQVTTARDMATLGRALQDRFPRHFHYFATSSFKFGKARIANHNRLLGRVAGVNGIKTGYTKASGFNLVSSVDHNGKKLVAVVMGGTSGKSRDQRMASLISDYMPRAYAGNRTAPLLGAPVTASAVASLVPAPRLKPDAGEPIETGSVAVAAKAPVTEEDQTIAQGDIADDDPAPEVSETAAVVVTGWKIQIAAAPTESAAKAMLDSATAKASKMLSGRSPYTEPIVKGNTTLYRARFAGFTSKESAREACSYLTKQKFACLALSD
jgi:D-alanyl-D-alanine carboxypeptidase